MNGAPTISIGERIDRLPLSGFHWRLLLVSGMGWMFDAMDIALIAFVLPVVAKEWNLSPMQMGLGGSASLAGMLIGAILAGILADRYGRKKLFAATMVLFSVATGLCGLAWSFGSLVVLRFIAVLGLGGE